MLHPGEAIEVAELADLRGFGAGWSLPDPTAIWTHGTRAELLLAAGDASRLSGMRSRSRSAESGSVQDDHSMSGS